MLSKNRLFIGVPTVIFVAIIASFAAYQILKPNNRQVVVENTAEDKISTNTAPKIYTTLKILSGEQMYELYDSFSYPNTEKITTPPFITGDADTDAHIRALAEKRGYKMRAIPQAQILKKGKTALGDPFLLQYKASVDWDGLIASAKNDGYNIGSTSAFRSIEDQRFLFMQAFNGAKIPVSKVVSGQYDKAIDDLLALAAIPGYSRHHTGYTLDFSCDGGSALIFKNTRCYDWVSKNNFENVKKFGWIPSYPEGTPPQGPNPEPWEFVWVGKDVLYK